MSAAYGAKPQHGEVTQQNRRDICQEQDIIHIMACRAPWKQYKSLLWPEGREKQKKMVSGQIQTESSPK